MKKLKINSLSEDYIDDIIFDHLEDKLNEEKQISIINYYIKKIINDELDSKDKIILRLLDDDIKKLIFSKVSMKTDFSLFTKNNTMPRAETDTTSPITA